MNLPEIEEFKCRCGINSTKDNVIVAQSDESTFAIICCFACLRHFMYDTADIQGVKRTIMKLDEYKKMMNWRYN